MCSALARLGGDPLAADWLAVAYLATVMLRGYRLSGVQAAARLSVLVPVGRAVYPHSI
jgi:hypothetical protein